MTEIQQKLDHVLVHLFGDILRIEETSLVKEGVHGLSMREIHILQAIGEAGENNAMSMVARRLHVTAGSMTVAVDTLVRKGYVSKVRAKEDKRRVNLILTEKAQSVETVHRAFHDRMTAAVIDHLDEKHLEALCEGLDLIDEYFCGTEATRAARKKTSAAPAPRKEAEA